MAAHESPSSGRAWKRHQAGIDGLESNEAAYQLKWPERPPVLLEREPDPLPGEAREARARLISAGYFDTLKLRLLAGRGIAETAAENSPMVGVINETLARRFFEGLDPAKV